jgi:beta-lactam-binding protein with PASTA domain
MLPEFLKRGYILNRDHESVKQFGVSTPTEVPMANSFGADILIQSKAPMKAANFYVKELGFEITDKKSNMISLHGNNINLFIERGPALGPVLEVTVKSVPEAKARLKKKGCRVVKDEPDFPRVYIKDPHGLIYNLIE